MTAKYFLPAGMAALAIAAGLMSSGARAAQQPPAPSAPPVTVDADDIGGVVAGPKGPEAGVWVIAETSDLPTKFAKIVVTDDRGRYLLPGPAEGELLSVGPWIRTGRFAEGHGLAGQGRQPDRDRRAGREGRRSLLSGGLLVLADARAGQVGVRGHRRCTATASTRACAARPTGSGA